MDTWHNTKDTSDAIPLETEMKLYDGIHYSTT